jgi:cytochrome c biogenesis protein CcmG, thiol:disulfide interchange protein DsbE
MTAKSCLKPTLQKMMRNIHKNALNGDNRDEITRNIRLLEAMDIPGLEIEPSQSIPRKRGLTPGSIVLLLGVLAVIVVIGVQLVRRNSTQPTSGPAPDFTMPLYRESANFRLSEQRGKIVVVNFWGSWCGPCREEAPELEAIAQRYADQGVVVVGVNFRDTEDAALAFLDEFNITYPNGIDLGERITTEYHVTGAPETFVIDHNGDVQEFFWGQVSAETLSPVLDELLANRDSD